MLQLRGSPFTQVFAPIDLLIWLETCPRIVRWQGRELSENRRDNVVLAAFWGSRGGWIGGQAELGSRELRR